MKKTQDVKERIGENAKIAEQSRQKIGKFVNSALTSIMICRKYPKPSVKSKIILKI